MTEEQKNTLVGGIAVTVVLLALGTYLVCSMGWHRIGILFWLLGYFAYLVVWGARWAWLTLLAFAVLAGAMMAYVER